MIKFAAIFKPVLSGTFATLVISTLISVAAPSTAEAAPPASSCSVTCSNGTSCSASGASDCSCGCGFWTGNASCSCSGSVSLTFDQIDALVAHEAQQFSDILLSQPDATDGVFTVAETVLLAHDALLAGDAETYYVALKTMDVTMTELSLADRDFVFAVINSLVAP
jgi:hypothetical protein